MLRPLFLFLGLLILVSQIHAQTPTVGLTQHDSTGWMPGYMLFSPMSARATYLIDKCGNLVNSWTADQKPGLMGYLTEDGLLARTAETADATPFDGFGGIGGIIELFDWDGTLLWHYEINDNEYIQHHDISPMPNGNILAIAWHWHDSIDVMSRGRMPGTLDASSLWTPSIWEIRPIFPDSAELVWRWDVWDHLIQNYDSTKADYGEPIDHPERFDLNYSGWSANVQDWIHVNGLDYNPGEDLITFSSRLWHEIYVIDHSTTMQEAAGHTGGNFGKGGDILYRWGNPASYGAGTNADRIMHAPHHANWVPPGYPNAGDIVYFNNGSGRPGGEYSTADRITPPRDSIGNFIMNPGVAAGPDSAKILYIAPNPTDLFANFVSGAEQLPNGNNMVYDGMHGTFFEVDTSMNILWKYINPVSGTGIYSQGDIIPGLHNPGGSNNPVFRGQWYPMDFSGFAGRDMSPGAPVELDPWPSDCVSPPVDTAEPILPEFGLYPNPAEDYFVLELPLNTAAVYQLFDYQGRFVFEGVIRNGRAEIDVSHLDRGMYVLRVPGFEASKLILH